MKIGVLGYTGKNGSLVCKESPDVSVAVSKSSNNFTMNQITYSNKVEDLFKCDTIIDFSSTEASMELIKKASLQNFQGIIVECVTGFSEEEKNFIRSIDNLKVILTNNTSFGIIAILNTIGKIVSSLPECEISIIEKHRAGKKDSPSGTAIAIKDAIEQCQNIKSVGMHSIRSADIPGIHSVEIRFQDQTITIKHEVHSRKCFAKGAIFIAKKAQKIIKEDGIFDEKDLFNIIINNENC